MRSAKKYIKYAVWLVLFFFFSNIIIKVCLETSYVEIEKINEVNLAQVEIETAEATKVNGRIKGKIVNSTENKINNKYLKFDFYSKRNILLGSNYIDVSSMRENETQDIDMHFKLQDVDHYDMSFVDEEPEKGKLELLPKDMSKKDIFWATFLAVVLFY